MASLAGAVHLNLPEGFRVMYTRAYIMIYLNVGSGFLACLGFRV